MTEFGNLIRTWRGERSLSQAAKLIGCTKAHLWEMETGRSRNPTIRTLAGIAQAYEGSVPYLAHLAARSLLAGETSPPSAELGAERSDRGREAKSHD